MPCFGRKHGKGFFDFPLYTKNRNFGNVDLFQKDKFAKVKKEFLCLISGIKPQRRTLDPSFRSSAS